MKVGDLVRSPSGDVGFLIKVNLKDRSGFSLVLFNYGEHEVPKGCLELVNEVR